MALPIYELFDIKQTQAREKRQIFTGNVIRAYEKYAGKLINFTDSRGQVRQGLLMRKGFDIEKELANQPVKLPTVGNCNQFFAATDYSGRLQTKDQIMSVFGGGDGSVTLTCPRAKDVGGRYYLDRVLLEQMPGREFVSVGQDMRVWVPPENAQDVMNYFYAGRGGLLAYSQQDVARNLLGISLPKLEEVTLAELQAMAEEQPPIIDAPTTVNELQQTIAGLEQALQASNIADLERSLEAEIDETQIPAAEQMGAEAAEMDDAENDDDQADQAAAMDNGEPYAVMTEDGYLLIRQADGWYADDDLEYTLEDLEAAGIGFTPLTQAEVENLNRSAPAVEATEAVESVVQNESAQEQQQSEQQQPDNQATRQPEQQLEQPEQQLEQPEQPPDNQVTRQPEQQLEQPTYYLLVPGTEPLLGPFAEWDDADLFRRQNPDFKNTPIRDLDFVQPLLAERGSLTAEGYQQAGQAQQQAVAVAVAQQVVSQFLQDAGLTEALQSGIDLTAMIVNATSPAPVVIEADQSGRLFITRYQDMTVTANGMDFSAQEMDLVECQLVIDSNGQLREVAIGQAGVPEYDLVTGERTLIVTSRENLDAPVAKALIELLREEGYVESIQAGLAERQQQQQQQQAQRQEVEQHLLLSPYPAELIERADQIDQVGPFATREEIDQFFVRFSDLASQSSVSYFNVEAAETWALVREAKVAAISPQTFLQTFEREVITEVTGIDPEREAVLEAQMRAEVDAQIAAVWTPEFVAQLQAVNGMSMVELTEIRQSLTDQIGQRMVAGEEFLAAYAGVLEAASVRTAEVREPEEVAAIAEPEVAAAREAQAAATPDPERAEMPLEYYTLRAESLARTFLQMSGFGQNGRPVVADIANREAFELSLTHPDYPNAPPLVIAKIDDLLYFEQALTETSGPGNKSLQFRLIQEGTAMVLVDTIVGQNQNFSPEAAVIQFESWLELDYPALVLQQYPERVNPVESAQAEAESVAQAQPTTEVDAPLISADMPLESAPAPVVAPPTIADVTAQSGRSERNIVRFLYQTGIADVMLQGMADPNLDQGFHLPIANPPMMQLVIERHDDLVYVTHYREPQHELDDSVMDAEMVFQIRDDGTLKLRETAVQDPIRGGELRTTGVRANRGFADTFSRNILDQGFVEAGQVALAAKLGELQQQPEPQQPEPVEALAPEVAAAPAIATDGGFEAEDDPDVSQPELVVEVADIPVAETEAAEAAEATEATVKGLDPRADIVQRFRDRIQEGTRTRMKGDDLEQLVTHFVNDIAQMRDQGAIKERCAAELSLLAEGFPQRSISSKYMPIYRKALNEAIETGAMQLDDRNSHIVTWQSRDGKESGKTQEHFALTYFKYDQRTYEQLRQGVADTRSQPAPQVETVESVGVAEPAIAPPVLAEVETVAAVQSEPSTLTFLESVQQLCAEHPNQIVFAKVDQFWESFYDDAVTVAKVLNVPLTNRPGGESQVPMAGFHENHTSQVMTKLQGAGYTPFFSNLAIAQRESVEAVVEAAPTVEVETVEVESVSAEPAAVTGKIYSEANVAAEPIAVAEVIDQQPVTEAVTETPATVVEDVAEAEAAVITPIALVESTEPEPVVAESRKNGKSNRRQAKASKSTAATPMVAEAVAAVSPVEIETALPALEIPTPESKPPESADIEVVATAEMGVNPLEVTQQMLVAHDPPTLVALQQFSQSREAKADRYSPSLKEMADWLSHAQELGRDTAYLKRITQLSNEVLAGTDEVFAAPADRNLQTRNTEFTLSKAAYQAMRRDQEEARAMSLSQMARGILAVTGKDNGQQVLFERPNGNYRLTFDKQSRTLTVESKNAARGVILTDVNGVLQHHAVTDLDQQIFKAFTDAVQQRIIAPKVAAGKER